MIGVAIIAVAVTLLTLHFAHVPF